MPFNKISMPLLLIWGFVSVVLFLLGIRFSGGILNVFIGPPANADLISIAFWLMAWALVLAPFPLLMLRLIQFFMR